MALIPSRLPLIFAAIVLAMPRASGADAANKPEHKVALDVRATTWREGEKPFDVGALFTERLQASGVATVPAAEAEATLEIEYTERKGVGYSMFYTGPATSYGTNITTRLRLMSRTGELQFEIRYFANTPQSVQGLSPHEAALEAFKEHGVTRHGVPLVRASLGSSEALRTLLPLILDPALGPAIQSIATRLRFSPTDPSDRAWLAVARDDYTAARELGRPAVPALIARGGTKSAAALAEIGDPRAAEHVLEQALHYAISLSPGDIADALVYFDAVGRLGDAFAIGPLEELADPNSGRQINPQIREAARKALASVRLRFAEKFVRR